jgi:hypothetical protein
MGTGQLHALAAAGRRDRAGRRQRRGSIGQGEPRTCTHPGALGDHCPHASRWSVCPGSTGSTSPWGYSDGTPERRTYRPCLNKCLTWSLPGFSPRTVDPACIRRSEARCRTRSKPVQCEFDSHRGHSPKPPLTRRFDLRRPVNSANRAAAGPNGHALSTRPGDRSRLGQHWPGCPAIVCASTASSNCSA